MDPKLAIQREARNAHFFEKSASAGASRSSKAGSKFRSGYGGNDKDDEASHEAMDKQVTKFFAAYKKAENEKREHRDRVDRTLQAMRKSFQEAAREAEPDELPRLMQEHLHAEDELMRADLRMWSPDDFESLTILGKGGFGTVHLVRLKVNDQIYALKQMSKEHYKKKNALVFNERDALAGMSSRWCAKLLCAFQDSTNVFMAMEFLQGGSLTTHITRRGRLSLEETAFYVAELIEAVSEVHRYGHVHRDLKPDNIMLTTEGHLKLLDFGLSAVQDENGTAKCDLICGTPEYMAPEAFDGYSSCKSDIWAIGVITYECLTGLLPFDVPADARTAMHKMDAIADQAFNVEEHLPRKLKLARDRQFVIGTPDSDFEKGRHFLTGVLRSNDEERLSLSECREEAVFEGLDFASLHKIRPPLSVKVSGSTDLTYFDVPDCEPESLPKGQDITEWNTSMKWTHFELDGQVSAATKQRKSKY